MLSTLHFLSILNNKTHIYSYALLDQSMFSQWRKIYNFCILLIFFTKTQLRKIRGTFIVAREKI
jgi:hypothetical protein